MFIAVTAFLSLFLMLDFFDFVCVPFFVIIWLSDNLIMYIDFNSVPIFKDVVKSIDDDSEIGLSDDPMKVSLHNDFDLSKNDVEIW